MMGNTCSLLVGKIALSTCGVWILSQFTYTHAYAIVYIVYVRTLYQLEVFWTIRLKTFRLENFLNSTSTVHPLINVLIANCLKDLIYLIIHFLYTPLHRALEASKLLGGEELVPFYPMLEGGKEGNFFAEMKDYFYYAQIKK